MNSVLLVGHQDFADAVRSQVRGLNSLTVSTVTDVSTAKNALVATVPDVVIAQADLLLGTSMTQIFGQGHSLYIIVIELTQYGEGDVASLCAQRIEKTALALESGADAFLWLPPQLNTIEKKLEESGGVGLTFPSRTHDAQSDPHPSYEETPLVSGFPMGHRSPSTMQTTLPTQPSSVHKTGTHRIVFRENQCRLIQAHVQLGLSQAQRYRDLSRINDWLSAVALVDALTQINNRRAFDLELPNQIKMARTKGTALSLMVLDIDYFKSVNDRFGHIIGDDMLKQLAQRLLANMRFYDTPFRYGGEEFIVTLSNTDITEGITIANRLKESIASEPFRLPQPFNGIKALEITVSIGITELTAEDDEQGNSFLNRADQNLLRAKALGRNRVIGPAD